MAGSARFHCIALGESCVMSGFYFRIQKLPCAWYALRSQVNLRLPTMMLRCLSRKAALRPSALCLRHRNLLKHNAGGWIERHRNKDQGTQCEGGPPEGAARGPAARRPPLGARVSPPQVVSRGPSRLPRHNLPWLLRALVRDWCARSDPSDLSSARCVRAALGRWATCRWRGAQASSGAGLSPLPCCGGGGRAAPSAHHSRLTLKTLRIGTVRPMMAVKQDFAPRGV